MTELAQVTAGREMRQEPPQGPGDACRWIQAEASALSSTAGPWALGRSQPEAPAGPSGGCGCCSIQATFVFLGSSACMSMLQNVL